MKIRWIIRFVTFVIVTAIISESVSPVFASALSAPLSQARGTYMVPILGLVSSWFHRNRTYKNAEAFIADMQQQYDKYLTTLNQQLASGTIYTPAGSGADAQQAAYEKEKALLAQERDLALAFAESIKKSARKDFNQAAKDQVMNIVLSTGFAQKVLGAIYKGFGQAQTFVDVALNQVQGNGEIATQIRGIKAVAGQIQLVGGLIGGQTGADLYANVQGIIDKMDEQTTYATNNLNSIKKDLSTMQTSIQGLMSRGYFATSSEVTQTLAAQLVGLGPGTPASEAILNILGIRKGTSKQSIRESGLALLAAGQNARCRRIINDLMTNLKQLESGTTGEEVSGSNGETCTAIDIANIKVVDLQAKSPTVAKTKQQGSSASSGSFTPFTEQDCEYPHFSRNTDLYSKIQDLAVDCVLRWDGEGDAYGSANFHASFNQDLTARQASFDHDRQVKQNSIDNEAGNPNFQVLVDEPSMLLTRKVFIDPEEPVPTEVVIEVDEIYNGCFRLQISLSLRDISVEKAETVFQDLLSAVESNLDQHYR